MPKNKDGITLIESHEYMTVRADGWSFTVGYSGEKANGTLVKADGVFEKMIGFVKDFKVKNPGTKNGDAMRSLATKATLDALWPEWKAPLAAISIGDMVKVPTFAKKFPGEYEVIAVKRTSADLRVAPGSIMNFSKHEMVVVGKKAAA